MARCDVGVDVQQWRSLQREMIQVVMDLRSVTTDFEVFDEALRILDEERDRVAEHGLDRVLRFMVVGYLARFVMGLRRHVRRGQEHDACLRDVLDALARLAPTISADDYFEKLAVPPHDPTSEWHGVPPSEVERYVRMRTEGGLPGAQDDAVRRSIFRPASADGRSLCAGAIRGDIETLEQQTKRIAAFADKHVAHRASCSHVRGETMLRWDELAPACEAVISTVERYELLLLGVGCELRVVHAAPWRRGFDLPLRRPRSERLDAG